MYNYLSPGFASWYLSSSRVHYGYLSYNERHSGTGQSSHKGLWLQGDKLVLIPWSSCLLKDLRERRSCWQSWEQSKDSEFCLCLERGNIVTAAWPHACSHPASYPDFTPALICTGLTCGCSGLGRARPRRSHPDSPSPQVHADEADEVGPW